MDIATYGLWIYLLYLILPWLFGYKMISMLYIKYGGKGMSIASGIIFIIIFYTVGIVLWLTFCFTAGIGWSIETLPLGGIILSGFSSIIAVVIMLGIFLWRYRERKAV
ncbi:hypothetical protein [Paenibacillus sp. YIM B09110]|uniref:hypothetical protein n=1 Tax=Paenibacillus sp. YIM B09110 TaxID=3126102 RepID=UPI00301E511C